MKDVLNGRFTQFMEMESRREGGNTITPLHSFAQRLQAPLPEDVGMRIIEVPPFGCIPGHSHDKEDSPTTMICLQGSGIHWIEEDGDRVEHKVSPMAANFQISLHAPAEIEEMGLASQHGYVAGSEGMLLLSIYNTSKRSDEQLEQIHRGRLSVN